MEILLLLKHYTTLIMSEFDSNTVKLVFIMQYNRRLWKKATIQEILPRYGKVYKAIGKVINEGNMLA